MFLNAFSIKCKRRQVGFKWKKVNTNILFFKSDPMGGRVCECTDKDMEIPKKNSFQTHEFLALVISSEYLVPFVINIGN